MSLNQANAGMEYCISNLNTDDEEIKSFLFTLGCYSGERITVVSKKKRNLVISIKGARYNIDCDLGDIIFVQG
ncbi:MAG: FeoA family protein [Bacillota bacterium]|nr:FeoA family protein [Bacillota bacterium]